MGSLPPRSWRQLSVAVIGGGIGGMSVAIALRRSGHKVTVYERADFAGEGDPVVLRSLINRDWYTGEPVSVYSLDDYEKRWGHVYNMFHRQDMHKMLKDTAMQEQGEGEPVKLLVNHQCQDIDFRTGSIVFKNGTVAQHDLIVGADGIGSVVRLLIGVHPEKKPSDQSCLHCNVYTEDAVKAGLVDYSQDSALEYWGGQEGKWDKIVLSPCNGGKLLSYYCFFPRTEGDYTSHSWGSKDLPVEELLKPYPNLDKQVLDHLRIGHEIQPWRLWVHQPYPYLARDTVCLLGDAGHPMMPHQSQGACMAIEDAAAIGILFSKRFFQGDIEESLATYNEIRLPRVTRVQAAAAKAAYNINERIGFSVNKDTKTYKVEDAKKVLTIEEMNAYDMYHDIEEVLARRRDETYTGKHLHGLPIGMELPNGVVIGQ
ncbi:FAD-dependent urate hydroxylase [Cyphellophora attinorum]|uniref:FAD-dependent urate hydroxylase n=1 Tax=Cyphellophora attinorum TaxID=1664694 RepID=A0A0N1H7C2_9EURO|nr:FAD-dependent urate hydroxylase [Phialophora attinorum]KPI37462.1 FAD-dependent urate hydroxylase [Phialophora attinorum]